MRNVFLLVSLVWSARDNQDTVEDENNNVKNSVKFDIPGKSINDNLKKIVQHKEKITLA
jgi:hypothetical protein